MKKFLAIVLSCAMVLSMAACGAKPAETTAAATEAAATEAQASGEHAPVTLEVSIVETDFLDMWNETIKPKFEAEYPWITLQDVGTGESKGEFHSTRAAANDLPPVMQTDNGDTYYALIDAGKLEDLSGTEAAKNIPQSYKDAYTYNGTLFGLTQGAAYDAMFFNMAVLKEAGWEKAPENWDEFIQCCADVQAKTDADVLCYAGAKTTTAWMAFESIAVNVIGPKAGEGAWEEAVRNGSLNLADYPEVAERMAALAPFIAEGSSTMTEDDVTACMTDGDCAMAIAGNWTSSNIVKGIAEATGNEADAVMTPPPFNNAGEACWLAATPESSFGMAKVSDPAIKEARDIFFEWIFKAENFRYIQNARGTCPVLTTITEDQIVLPDATKAFVVQTGACTPFSMSFNNVNSEVNSSVTAAINEVFIGAKDAAAAMNDITGYWAADPKNPSGEAPAETQAAAPAEGGEKVLNMSFQYPNNYNTYNFIPATTDTGLTGNLMWLTLIEADKDLNPTNPEIMKDWNVSEDGKTITMTLDPDWKWSDGSPITMDDVLFTLKLYCKSAPQVWAYVTAACKYIEGAAEYDAGTADDVSGITADGDVLTIKLTAPFASFINLMCQVAVLPEKVYGSVPQDETWKTNEAWKCPTVTSGPFMVTDNSEGTYYILEKNPYYKGTETYNFTKIVNTVAENGAVAAQTGSNHFFSSTSADDYNTMKTVSGYHTVNVPIVYFRFMAFNFFDADGNRKSDIDDIRIRQAFAYAIDWAELIDGIFGETATLTQTGVLHNDKDYAGDWYEYDPEKAKQLLDEAGFDYNHTVKCFYYYTDQSTIDLMDAIAYYLDMIGVKFEAVYTSNSTGDIYEGRTQDMAYFGLSAYDALSWYQMYTRSTMDAMLGSVAVFGEDVTALELAFTPELKAAALAKLQQIEKDNVFFLPVYTLTQQVYVNDALDVDDSIWGNSWYYYDYKFDEWDLK